MYDIIGDVHGHATLLKNLLKSMGYTKTQSGFSHSERKAIFVGDFVNRGPEIRTTLQIIREMTGMGSAIALLGNHEINALLYSMKRDKKGPLLSVSGKRYGSVAETVLQFKNFPEEWKDYRKWLRSLPLFYESDGLRVVHACWKDDHIRLLREELFMEIIPKSIFRDLVLDSKSALSQSILQTTRGINLIMPPNLRIFDNQRRQRHLFRIKWWIRGEGLTFRQYAFESKFRLPDYTIPPEILPEAAPYPPDAPPLFFGHYCRGNGPFVISDNLCCVDACVTGKRRLAAYRWDGEAKLNAEKMMFSR